ncbi:hypothetical protein HK102_005860 [Quaeritorhiza haematococci]|nr:hypothetical protein HK102_005860 [Quaeritorhiza haematococci]
MPRERFIELCETTPQFQKLICQRGSTPPDTARSLPRCSADTDCADPNARCIDGFCTAPAPSTASDITSNAEIFSKSLIYSHIALAAYAQPDTITIPGCNKVYRRHISQDSPAFDLKYSIYTDDQFVENKGGEAIVTFKGTETLDEVVVDGLAGLVQCDILGGERCGLVHAGFKAGWEDLRPKVSDIVGLLHALAGAVGQPITFGITGHSLGGALARLAAMELSFRGIPVSDV